MADVEQRAEAEAAHKGLTGQERASYVGGVFNRIRQAHSRATTPGAGARHLKRAARKEARREAQNRRDRLTERANGEAFRLRARTRREEGRTTAAKAKPAAVHERYAANVNGVDLSRNVANIESYERAIEEAKSGKMGAPASEVPGIVQRLTTGRDTEIARYKEAAQKAAKAAAPAPKPKPDAFERKRERAIAQAVQHGAPEVPPTRPAAAQASRAERLRQREDAAQKELADAQAAYQAAMSNTDSRGMVTASGFNRAADRVEKAARALRSVQTQRRNLENGAPEVPPTRPAAPAATARPATKVVNSVSLRRAESLRKQIGQNAEERQRLSDELNALQSVILSHTPGRDTERAEAKKKHARLLKQWNKSIFAGRELETQLAMAQADAYGR